MSKSNQVANTRPRKTKLDHSLALKDLASLRETSMSRVGPSKWGEPRPQPPLRDLTDAELMQRRGDAAEIIAIQLDSSTFELESASNNAEEADLQKEHAEAAESMKDAAGRAWAEAIELRKVELELLRAWWDRKEAEEERVALERRAGIDRLNASAAKLEALIAETYLDEKTENLAISAGLQPADMRKELKEAVEVVKTAAKRTRKAADSRRDDE